MIVAAMTTPLWPAEWTAAGTVALAGVTVAVIITTIVITRQDRKRADTQLVEQQKLHQREIAEERTLADRRLAEQLAHSDAQLAAERTHSTAQLEGERQRAQEREQLIEAYNVMVFNGMTSINEGGPDDPIACPLAIVVNGGHYSITNVETQFLTRTSTFKVFKVFHASAFYMLPDILLAGEEGASQSTEWPAPSTVLTPSDPGLRIIGLDRPIRELIGSYAVVRWADRWDTRWEHCKGEVRQIFGNEPWPQPEGAQDTSTRPQPQ